MGWDIKKVVRVPVYRLFLDGVVIQDEHGRPVDYATEEDAQHVAANWDSYRAPTIAELRSMPDSELQRRADGDHFPMTVSTAERWWRRLF